MGDYVKLCGKVGPLDTVCADLDTHIGKHSYVNAEFAREAPLLKADLDEAVHLLYGCALDDRGYCNACGAERVGDDAGTPDDPRLEMHSEDCRLRVFLSRHPEKP